MNHTGLDGSGWVVNLDSLFLGLIIPFAQENQIWLISQCHVSSFWSEKWTFRQEESSAWLFLKLLSRSSLLNNWGTTPVWKEPGKCRSESLSLCPLISNSLGSTDSTAVCCSHSPFTCGKAETGRSWVCASCKFKATILGVKWVSPKFRHVQCRANMWAPCQGSV